MILEQGYERLRAVQDQLGDHPHAELVRRVLQSVFALWSLEYPDVWPQAREDAYPLGWVSDAIFELEEMATTSEDAAFFAAAEDLIAIACSVDRVGGDIAIAAHKVATAFGMTLVSRAAGDATRLRERLADVEARAATSKASRRETFSEKRKNLEDDVIAFARTHLEQNPLATAANLQALYRKARELPINSSNREAQIISRALRTGDLIRPDM